MNGISVLARSTTSSDAAPPCMAPATLRQPPRDPLSTVIRVPHPLLSLFVFIYFRASNLDMGFR